VAWDILEGDCIDVMATMPAESVDALITSPPYAMQRKATYGGVPEAEYPSWTVAWMREARRLLKPDGSVIINIRPHIRNGQISDYVLRTRLALRDAGWAELPELIWRKPDAAPTGSPNRPRRSWESLLWFAKHGQAWADPKANGTPMGPSALKYGHEGMGRTADRNGWQHSLIGATRFGPVARCTDVVDVSCINVRWERHPGFDHPAPFPIGVAEWCSRLICPHGGTILDPFSGSASTGVAAIRNGWDYIGIEAMHEYADMSRRRLEAEQAKAA
jgi:site-specific DNA-methyltransferase (adenine-specific)